MCIIESPRQDSYLLCAQKLLPYSWSSTHFDFLWWEQKTFFFPKANYNNDKLIPVSIIYVRPGAKNLCDEDDDDDDDVMINKRTQNFILCSVPLF